ncbi:MAG: leucine-rich repeat domain-containing protein [Promethearchaeota archaeon]|nr:MAG: leucine-rich repeat domain-containing protein [Candidatus Lokiarchaeota archaeon]
MKFKNPIEIYKKYKREDLNEDATLKVLISLLEHSHDSETRKQSLRMIKRIKTTNLDLYKTLENILISDENEELRASCAELIVNSFLEKGKRALKWAIQIETSPDFFARLIYILRQKDSEFLRKLITNQLEMILKQDIQDSPINYYIFKLKSLFADKKVSNYSVERLIELFLNFKVIKYLINTNQISFYEIQNGLIIKLSLYPKEKAKLSDIKGLKELKRLKGLGISGKIKLDVLHLFKDLRTLIIDDNPLFRLEQIKYFNKLEILIVNGCKIEEIYNLNKLKQLKRLNLGYNNITEIKGLKHLKHLKILKLNNNQINELQGLSKLTHLKELNLEYNLIPRIKCLVKLENLEVLTLKWNRISKVSGLNNLKKLYYLDLSFNEIEHLNGLKKLTNLEYLNLKYNLITEIKEIRKVKHIDHLALKNKYISKKQVRNYYQKAKTENLKNLV